MTGTNNVPLPVDPRPLVLVFIAFYDPFISGGERFAIELMKRLKNRYRFVVFTSRALRRLPKTEVMDGIEVVRLGIGHDWDKYLFPILAPLRARKYRPALVHGIIESFAAMALAFYHLIWPQVPTVLSLQSGSLDAPRLKKRIPEWWLRWVHSVPTAIHAISQSLAERAKRCGARDVEVIPNGVEIERFRQASAKIQKQPFLIRTVGRLHIDKGYDLLVKAMPEVLAAVPEAYLEIGGGGDQQQNLQTLIRSLDLDGKVSLLGPIPYETFPQFMAAAQVFVSPSRAEGMGIAFIEAQAAGTVTVGTSVGGIPDIIEDGVSGRLAPSEDPHGLALILIDLLTHPEQAKQMADVAQARLDRFSWDQVAASLGMLFDRLIHHSV